MFQWNTRFHIGLQFLVFLSVAFGAWMSEALQVPLWQLIVGYFIGTFGITVTAELIAIAFKRKTPILPTL